MIDAADGLWVCEDPQMLSVNQSNSSRMSCFTGLVPIAGRFRLAVVPSTSLPSPIESPSVSKLLGLVPVLPEPA